MRLALIFCTFLIKTFANQNIGRLSKNDPNSFSNPEEVRAHRLNLKWKVDFSRKIISGIVNYELEFDQENATQMVFDIRDDLKIFWIRTLDGKDLEYKIGQKVGTFGSPLIVQLPKSLHMQKVPSLSISYETWVGASALQWLEPEQTHGKKFPYLFSQCQAIQARSLLPCQDTPSTKASYSAQIIAPNDLTVLMSAILQNSGQKPGKNVVKQEVGALRDLFVSIKCDANERIHFFEQKIPIPSYLIAIVVGDLKSVKLGPRSSVWAEEAFVKEAAFDFSETEKMIQVAEKLFTPYIWGIYDILVLPPSFPFGGMENPCLTFATPTLLTGDKSLANVIAHEIAHSWFGNLITNRDFEDFWLNEGFTEFAERKIIGVMKGEPTRHFLSIQGLRALTERLQDLGLDNPITFLTPNMTGIDPDDSYSIVPYEKGYTFLFYLEQLVGDGNFGQFLKDYLEEFSYKSISTEDFKNYFINYFKNKNLGKKVNAIEWDKWLKTPGMPIYIPDYDTSLLDICIKLKNRWIQWDHEKVKKCPFDKSDLDNFDSNQIGQFLTEFREDKINILGLDKMKALQKTYNFNSKKNAEIKCIWLRLCIKEKWIDQVPLALNFVTEQGRMKYIRSIYADLYAWGGEIRQMAINTFKSNQKFMMFTASNAVSKDLHVEL